MTQVLDRPTTETEVRTQTAVRPRPIELDREVRQLPPVGEPPGRFRWLGWLLGIAALAAIAWLVIAEITADDTPVASPSYVVTEGVTADPKVRTPVAMTQAEIESIRTGIPGTATLTEVSTLGHTPAESLEDATVNPMVYWAVQPTYATMMEEATVSPFIYDVTKSALPGVYWRHGEAIDEMTFGIYPPVAAPVAEPPAFRFDYWQNDLVLAARPMFPTDLDLTFGIWPAMYADPAPALTALPGVYWRHGEAIDEMTYGIYPLVAAPVVIDLVVSTATHGGHMNIMR